MMKTALIGTWVAAGIALGATAASASDDDRFRLFDTDRDGSISAREWDSHYQQMFREKDRNHDGVLSRREMEGRDDSRRRDDDYQRRNDRERLFK
ncbi:MAG TPA: hypothetical protein PLI51_08670 [bacterium]|nr:hypothetical protein [bacterium]HPQ66784.1 hypothetical protein [bacterium]